MLNIFWPYLWITYTGLTFHLKFSYSWSITWLLRVNNLFLILKYLFRISTFTINLKQLMIRPTDTLIFFLKTNILLGLNSDLALTILSLIVMIISLLKDSLWYIITKLLYTRFTNFFIDIHFFCFFCFLCFFTWTWWNLFFLFILYLYFICFHYRSFINYCLFIWFYWRWFYCSI